MNDISVIQHKIQAIANLSEDNNKAISRRIERIRGDLVGVKSVMEAEQLSKRAYTISEMTKRAAISVEVKIAAAELVLHCEYAVGVAMKAMPQSIGRPTKKSSAADDFPKPLKYKDLGISNRRADSCKRLASIPPVEFMDVIKVARAKAENTVDRASSCLSVRRVAEQIKSVERDGEPEFSSVIKPDDNWNFSQVVYDRIDGESGHGYIPGDLYANCLWYWTKPGDVVAAPMAGAGQIMRVYEDRAVWARPEPWELDIRMSDLSPRGPYADRMKQHDLRQSFPIEHADYIVMDVPYFGMVDGQYSKLETDIANMNMDGWTKAIGAIAQNCAMAQRANGLCTVISPNYLDTKTGQKIMTTDIIMDAFKASGYKMFDKAYASRRIQQNQGPGMGRLNNWAKRSRQTLTDIGEVMTFRRL